MSFLYPQPGWVFVDSTYSGDESGTFFEPFNTFAEGYADMPDGGALWFLEPGRFQTPGLLDRPCTIGAPKGGVTLHD